MKLFIDTADVSHIRKAAELGVLDGVTTNPSHVAKSGRPAAALFREICAMTDTPVSLETIGLSAEEMLNEGRELAKIAPNVVVKIPITPEGLKAVKTLSSEGIKTNVTVTFSPLQALLAAKCGATYISPFAGRLDAVAHDGMNLVREIKTIYANYGFATQIIVAAIRHPRHVLEAALCGADICTMSHDVLVQLYQHPLTDLGIDQFLRDWKSVAKA